jgi:hypothetical protein
MVSIENMLLSVYEIASEDMADGLGHCALIEFVLLYRRHEAPHIDTACLFVYITSTPKQVRSCDQPHNSAYC